MPRDWKETIETLQQRIGELINQRKEVLAKVYQLREQYRTLKKEYQPRIDELQTEADALAEEFKELYEASQEAYLAGEGLTAKVLSLRGHARREECEALNAQISSMFSVLRERRAEIDKGYKEAEKLQVEISSLILALRETKRQRREILAAPDRQSRPSFSGFSKKGIIRYWEAREFVNSFPSATLKEVGRISYSNQEAAGKFGNPILGRTGKTPEGKWAIEIFRHDPDVRENIFETIAHEIGHVAYSELSSEEIQEWAKLHGTTTENYQWISRSAIRSPEEDFCECFAKFQSLPGLLEDKDKRKYTFIQRVNRELRGTL